jgi:hypothetical protein
VSNGGTSPFGEDRNLRIGATIALAIAAGVLVWLLFVRDDDDSDSEGPRIVREQELAGIADDAGHPVYWAGPQEGTRIEVKEDASGNVYVRYLEDGAKAGTGRQDFLAVGTYPFPGAFAALQKVAEEKGAIVENASDGALVVSNESSPTSVYLAYPSEDIQVEVFDPDADRALELATSGAIRPVD